MYMDGSGSTSLPPTTTSSMTMTDCKDWYNHGAHIDGIYSINPDGRGSFNVFCDMMTDGGGWTVFQRHINGDLSFYDKLWNDYKVGFNNGLENNLWLGNDIIHVLTTKDLNVELRIDLWGDRTPNSFYPDGYWWEKHINFFIDDEAHFYTLHISSSYTGNATTELGWGISWSNGQNFGTVDANHGGDPSCFNEDQEGGWWMTDECAAAPLNGNYRPPSEGGFFWCSNTDTCYILKQSRMMLRSLM
uniref:Fibrinogen C-terminal domain-containing protein n=1 Tax=Plectus sambesii TaxID=2011161 RepID=A0A914WA39_9BILA